VGKKTTLYSVRVCIPDGTKRVLAETIVLAPTEETLKESVREVQNNYAYDMKVTVSGEPEFFADKIGEISNPNVEMLDDEDSFTILMMKKTHLWD